MIDTARGLVSYPFDTVRRRMFMQAGSGIEALYDDSVDCWKKMYDAGFNTLLKDALSTLFRSANAALLLVFYDEPKRGHHCCGELVMPVLSKRITISVFPLR